LLQEESLNGAPLLVYANKQDICATEAAELGAVDESSAVYAPPPLSTEATLAAALGLDGILGDRDRAWRVQACSAVRGDGLAEGMAWLLRHVVGEPPP
jgi:ADP-ribosylation factor-like protein 3